MAKQETVFDNIMQICLRRAVFYPDAEIHHAIAGFFDYGSIGTKIKHRWQDLWKGYFLGLEDNFHEIETVNVMPEKVFEASGHLKEFIDPVVECSKCGLTEKADHIVETVLKKTYEGLSPEEFNELIKKNNIKCPKCKGSFKEVGIFNMMLSTKIGPYADVTGYLRPETAQGVYVSFKREYTANREKLPLGLAIIGKAYRNEISPRQGLFRMREFSQAELQIFFDPSDLNKHPQFKDIEDYNINIVLSDKRDKGVQKLKAKKIAEKLPKMYVYYMARVQQFYLDIMKVPADKFRFYGKTEEEQAHYNKYQYDAEINFKSYNGFKEVMGLHYRTDYDLKAHEKLSKQSMHISKDGKKFIPHVIELSFGVDRNVFALLDLNFKQSEKRTYFSIPPRFAPYNAAVFPLVSKDSIDKKAREVYNLVSCFDVFYDQSGSIGRRYARVDEIGIPFCITIDYDTIKDNTVTIRQRDTTEQKRVKIDDLCKYFYKYFY